MAWRDATYLLDKGGIGEGKATQQGFKLRVISKDARLTKEMVSNLYFVFFNAIPQEAALFNPSAPREVQIIIYPEDPCGGDPPSAACADHALIHVNGNALFTKSGASRGFGVIAHEAMHIVSLRQNENCIHWDEGIADLARYWYGLDPQPSASNPYAWKLENPKPGQTYTASYTVTAKFLKWVSDKFGRQTIVELAAIIRRGACPNDAFWTAQTKKGVDALWSDYTKSL